MTTYNPCSDVVRMYLKQLESGFVTTSSEEGCFVVTPFVRPDGEFVEFAVEPQPSGRFRLTDMGDTLGYLHVHGLTLSRNILESTKRICRRYGASLEGAALLIQPNTQEEFGDALHKLMQTVLAVTDLIQKRRPMERLNFDAEVESLIIVSSRTYDKDYEVRGTRSVHSIRFHVNSNRNLLIQPVSATLEPVAFSWAERWAYRFNDILDRDDKWRCITVLDDRGDRSQIWSDRVLTPLRGFEILWNAKDDLLARLG